MREEQTEDVPARVRGGGLRCLEGLVHVKSQSVDIILFWLNAIDHSSLAFFLCISAASSKNTVAHSY